MGDAGGLSDTLRRMASGELRHERPAPDHAASRDVQLPRAARRVARPSRPDSAAAAAPAPAGRDSLKAAAVPACLITATLLLIPAVWAILVLAGFEVWRSDWPDARRMALAMLACAPVAAALIGGAWYLHRPPRRP